MSSWECPDCGFRVNGGFTDEGIAAHECDPRSVVRVAVARLEDEFELWMGTPWGKFAQHEAKRALEKP